MPNICIVAPVGTAGTDCITNQALQHPPHSLPLNPPHSLMGFFSTCLDYMLLTTVCGRGCLAPVAYGRFRSGLMAQAHGGACCFTSWQRYSPGEALQRSKTQDTQTEHKFRRELHTYVCMCQSLSRKGKKRGSGERSGARARTINARRYMAGLCTVVGGSSVRRYGAFTLRYCCWSSGRHGSWSHGAPLI